MPQKIITVDSTFADPDNPDENPDKVARFRLLDADRVCIGLYNNLSESITLTNFKIVFFPSDTATEAIDGPSTGAEWTNPEAGNNVIQHGNPVDPTTLAAGAKMYFILHNLNPLHSLQVLASVASGQGALKIEFNRGGS